MIIALALLTLVLLVVNAFFIYDDWQYKKLLKKDREWQEWKLAEQAKHSVARPSIGVADAHYISNSADWQIVSWHTYDSIVIGSPVDHTSRNYKAVLELIARLPTLQFERHPNKKQDTRLKLEHNSAMLIRNIHDGMELYIGIRDGVIKVGRSLTEGSFGRTVPVEDTTSN